MSATNDYDQAILHTLTCIPHGKICTYGHISNMSGHHGKARYVGYILKHLPSTSTIPWHRVINSQGRISFPKDSERYQLQVRLLEDEGICVINGTVSLKDYLWLG